MSEPAPKRETLEQLKGIIRQDLKLSPDAPIADDMPLIGGEFDLDSLDVLMLLTSLEKRFGLKIADQATGETVFRDVRTLAAYVERHAASPSAPQPVAREVGSDATQDALSRLPHRPPFRFLTRLDGIRPDTSGEALWTLDGSEDFFAGHFPGHPIVPGVLIAESLAQLSGIVSATNGAQEGRLAHVDVRFRELVTPPAEIRLRSAQAGRQGPLRRFQVEARVGDAVVAEGTVTLHVDPPPQESKPTSRST